MCLGLGRACGRLAGVRSARAEIVVGTSSCLYLRRTFGMAFPVGSVSSF